MAFIELKQRYWLSVAGTLGVGKSTFAELLRSRIPNSILLPEKYTENPYLENFYRDPITWALRCQLWFLRTKAKQIKTVPKILRRHIVIQDTPIQEDVHSYAAVLHDDGKISNEHWETYLQEFNHFSAALPHPTLLIYLSATVDTLMWRIQHRKRAFEADMDSEYIRKLNEYNKLWVQEYPLPVLQITTDALNLGDNPNPHDQERALHDIQDRLQRIFPPKVEPIHINGYGPKRGLRGRR